ncbi:MAG: hypothetical protein L0Y66_22145 [Myxococcaceae bacterium]|nr:hypothetical protein [Myxococcaceae bacterium]MCI0668899.1 hypothetical protein [Myxococcaceae bacterium]
MIPGSGRCHVHPDRAGIGVCIECHRVICHECTTQFEGINRCAACLTARQRAVALAPLRREWSVGNVLLSLLGAGGVYLVARGAAALLVGN